MTHSTSATLRWQFCQKRGICANKRARFPREAAGCSGKPLGWPQRARRGSEGGNAWHPQGAPFGARGAVPAPPPPPPPHPPGCGHRHKGVNRKLGTALPAGDWHQSRAGQGGQPPPSLPAPTGSTAGPGQAAARPAGVSPCVPPSFFPAGRPANDIYSLIRNLIKVSYHNVMALHFGLLVGQFVILHFQAAGGGGEGRAEG